METIKVNNIAGEIRLERQDGTSKTIQVAKIGIFEYDDIQKYVKQISESKDSKEMIPIAVSVAKMLFPFANREDLYGVDFTELIKKGLKIASGGDRTPEQKKTRGRRKKESHI